VLGVSFVVPVYNGARWLDEMLAAIFAQADGRPLEVLVVDDGSRDDSPAILRRFADAGKIRLLAGDGRGAAAAMNVGIRAATQPIICQVDQDVIVQPGWMARLTEPFADATVGAVQGYYATDPGASVWARAMGFDLEQRYGRIRGEWIDHVCTGNSAYRREALLRAGLFDETFGYGYDNDMSYRLAAAGYRLGFCREARSIHKWREGAAGYLRQQYGQGYGRLDLVAKHRGRYRGDDVSSFAMILHAPLMLCALLLAVAGLWWRVALVASGALVAALAVERLAAGIAASRRFRNRAGLFFPAAHLLRDLAWVGALISWSVRRARGQPRRPGHSM
jgi:glycosyltransferase involved in cell wall biosynthesis